MDSQKKFIYGLVINAISSTPGKKINREFYH